MNLKKCLANLFTLQFLLVLTLFPLMNGFTTSRKIPLETNTSLASTEELQTLFKSKNLSQDDLKKIKSLSLDLGGKSILILTNVMKDNVFNEKGRWLAPFLIGQIMGKKSSRYLAKFIKHPDWFMRLSVLKTLLMLKENQFGNLYAQALRDDSYLVRLQALENITQLKIKEQANQVWGMLKDERNYLKQDNKLVKTTIIKDIVHSVGILKFYPAQAKLFQMLKSQKYLDLFNEIDHSLEKLTGINSPLGTLQTKHAFWLEKGKTLKII